jgi:hypothetical protein
VKKLKQQAHRLVAATLLARDPAAVPFIRSSLHAAALWWADGDTTWTDANRSVGVESLAVELLATVPIVAVVAVPPRDQEALPCMRQAVEAGFRDG